MLNHYLLMGETRVTEGNELVMPGLITGKIGGR